MSASFDFSEVDRIVVGTVGEPGQRTFYLQIRQGGQLVSLKLEKQQVAALAQLLAEMLSDLPAPETSASGADELEEPVIAEWPIGDMQLSYDTTLDRIVVLAEEVSAPQAIDEPLADEPTDDGVARIAITREQAASIVIRSTELVAAGRPTCPLCGNPIDPTGHACPRTNGHAPRTSR